MKLFTRRDSAQSNAAAPTAEEFLAWALSRARARPLPKVSTSRRRALFAMLLAPFAGTWNAGVKASGIPGFRVTYDDRRLEVASAAGRWIIDVSRLPEDALLSAREDGGNIEITLLRAAIVGTNSRVDFKCSIDTRGGSIRISFPVLGVSGSTDFSQWVSGGTLELNGQESLEIVSSRRAVTLRLAGSGLRLGADWRLFSDSGSLELPGNGHVLVDLGQVRAALPLDRGDPGEAGLTVTVETLTMRAAADDARFPWLSLSKLAFLERCTGGRQLVLSFVPDGAIAVRCSLVTESMRIVAGAPELRSEHGVEVDVSHALLNLSYAQEAGLDSSSLVAHFGGNKGLVTASGIRTAIRGSGEKPIVQLDASAQKIEKFYLSATALGDAVDCDGIVCDTRSEGQFVDVRLAKTAKLPRTASFTVDGATGEVHRGSQPLVFHLRRREGRVDLWVELYNARLRCDLGGLLAPKLSKIDASQDAFAVFFLPPQHVRELSAVVDSTTQLRVPVIDPEKLQPRASAPSRVAFRLPSEIFPYPFSVESMLEWRYFEPVTGPESSEEYRDPSSTPLNRIATVINLAMMSLVPVRLATKPSPRPQFRWLTRSAAPADDGSNENWHARLIDEDLRPDPIVSSSIGMGVAEVEDWHWPATGANCGPSEVLISPLSMRDRFELRVLTFLRKFAPSLSASEIERTPRPLLGSVILSSQGGYFHLEGNWEVDELAISLVRYLHVIAQGRDVDVTVVREYFMYPFGHRLLLTKQTTRKGRPAKRAFDNADTVAGRLETRFFLLVKDDSITYPGWVQPIPMRTVNIAPECFRSPLLDFNEHGQCVQDEYCPLEPVQKTVGAGHWAHQAFWVTVGGRRYQYEFDGVDYAGRIRRFKREVILIENARDGVTCANLPVAPAVRAATAPWELPAAYLVGRFRDSRIAFNGKGGQEGTTELGPVDIAVAASLHEGDTDLELVRLSFTAKYKPPAHQLMKTISADAHTCPWVPTIHWVEGRFPTGMLPNAIYANGNGILRWVLSDVDTGLMHHPEDDALWLLSSNPSEGPFDLIEATSNAAAVARQASVLTERDIFALIDRRAKAPTTTVATSYASNTAKSGGLVSPDINLGAASRHFGASSLPRLSPNAVHAFARSKPELLAEFFPASSKLCGVELLKIIAPLFEGSGGEPPAFNSILSEVDDGPDSLLSDLSWSIQADDDPAKSRIRAFPDSSDANAFFFPGLYVDESTPTQDCQLELSASTNVSLLGLSPPEVNLNASVARFTVHIGWGTGSAFNGVRIPIERIAYVSRNGQKPDFQIDLGNIVMVGPALEFIDQIRKKLQELGQGESGWRIGFEDNGVVIDAPPIMFPNVELGAFSIENLGIYSGLHVPFFNGGGITCWFSLAKPDLHFRVVAGIYAGGGYALIELDTDHVRRFELCIEFGAAKSLSYGPVKGDVGILGGLIYKSLTAPAYQSPGLPETLQTKVVIEAFVRAFGTFSAWSLVSVFLELYVSMASSSGRGLVGTARFTISAKVAFVSYSYTASHQEQLQKRSDDSRSVRAERLARQAIAISSGVPESVIHVGPEADEVSATELLDYLSAFED